jgi:MFS family permease
MIWQAADVALVNFRVRGNRAMKPSPTSQHRGLILTAVCLSAFAITVDTTIVNVALPSLTRQLGANTRDLQWIVDGYNLAFASLVLSAGNLGDRFGRRPALLLGLVGFAAASTAAALCTSPGQLIAARFVMGAFAALIFPTTLAIISNTFPERHDRAKAVGTWGAVTGLGVAIGPVSGGLLLSTFAWPSVFLALVPVSLLAAAVVFFVVPESRAEERAPLDRAGLVTATLAIGSLIYTIIEAPTRGWSSSASLLGFALALVSGVVFVAIEARREHPMLDVGLFRERAFSAASGAVTVAFFALFGFIFLITQYFQFIRGYGTLSTGLRILPVALSIGVASVLGARLAARHRPRTHHSSRDGVHPQRPLPRQGRRRLGRQRRNTRGRRHARRGRHRQRLRLSVHLEPWPQRRRSSRGLRAQSGRELGRCRPGDCHPRRSCAARAGAQRSSNRLYERPARRLLRRRRSLRGRRTRSARPARTSAYRGRRRAQRWR